MLLSTDEEDDDEKWNYQKGYAQDAADNSGESDLDSQVQGDSTINNAGGSVQSKNVVSPNILPLKELGAGFPSDALRYCNDPFDFYELFMTDVWELIVRETNAYDHQRNVEWENATIGEIKEVISWCFQISIAPLPEF
ncbi:hypothetical protein KIN20_011766 [Parelaphostrongylus tenuis]|uniref:PiggyBac transposable element-derived protein domain-containing protein n=1 Tax=Parelaphostrongylus tenuis TaxID=148309 RepID=A0AAD5N0J2_PARTN|nr:hypothetical protein KIN20_011766 [Parelaphostrongylus tenuis]